MSNTPMAANPLTRAVLEIDLGLPAPVRYELDRPAFERLIRPWVDRTLASCRSALADARLTARDIGSPLFTYFFGRARLHGRAGIVSTARLSPAFHGLPDDEALTLRRAEVEVLHELGHLLGLAHCRDFACLMHVTTDVEALDARGTAFCSACSRRLPPPLGSDRPS